MAVDYHHILIEAVKRGSLSEVENVLKNPGVYKKAHTHHNLALRYAAWNGHTDIVKCLLKIPAVLKHVTDHDNEILHYAAYNGQLETVISLIQYPSVFKRAAARNNQALRLAAERGHLDVVIHLLCIPDVLAAAMKPQDEALVMAALGGHLDVVDYLLQIPGVLRAAARYHPELLGKLISRGELKSTTLPIVAEALGWPCPDSYSRSDVLLIEAISKVNHPSLQYRHAHYDSLWQAAFLLEGQAFTDSINALLEIPAIFAHALIHYSDILNDLSFHDFLTDDLEIQVDYWLRQFYSNKKLNANFSSLLLPQFEQASELTLESMTPQVKESMERKVLTL